MHINSYFSQTLVHARNTYIVSGPGSVGTDRVSDCGASFGSSGMTAVVRVDRCRAVHLTTVYIRIDASSSRTDHGVDGTGNFGRCAMTAVVVGVDRVAGTYRGCDNEITVGRSVIG